jgi:hypothetical protein
LTVVDDPDPADRQSEKMTAHHWPTTPATMARTGIIRFDADEI